jgi:hypothetical protein
VWPVPVFRYVRAVCGYYYLFGYDIGAIMRDRADLFVAFVLQSEEEASKGLFL